MASENTMVNRNIKGMDLEKAGKDEAAMKLYEKNVADGFTGLHPYNRLRLYYEQKSDVENLKRISECYLSVSYPNTDEKLLGYFKSAIDRLT